MFGITQIVNKICLTRSARTHNKRPNYPLLIGFKLAWIKISVNISTNLHLVICALINLWFIERILI